MGKQTCEKLFFGPADEHSCHGSHFLLWKKEGVVVAGEEEEGGGGAGEAGTKLARDDH